MSKKHLSNEWHLEKILKIDVQLTEKEQEK
jgi:hypothetical protein